MVGKRGAATGLSKNDSLVIKGVAILAMMWNHCFLEGRFEQFDISFFPLGQSRVANIAAFMKICVSLFAFVSGYGLYCTLEKESAASADNVPNNVTAWYRTRYIKSFSDYWLIVLLASIICQLLNGWTETVYFSRSPFLGCFYMLLDCIGVSSIFGTPTLIATWWYMSAALVFILCAPLIYWLMKKFGSVLCIGLVLLCVRMLGGYPGGTNYLSFLPAFIIGMACAKSDVFQHVSDFVSTSKTRYVVCVLILLAIVFICYKSDKILPTKQFWDFKYGLFTPIYVITIFLTLAKTPGISSVLKFLGEWSADVFLIHSFFRARYATELVYAPGSFMLVMLRLLAIGLAASFLFRIVKRIIRYDSFVSWLLKRRNGSKRCGDV